MLYPSTMLTLNQDFGNLCKELLSPIPIRLPVNMGNTSNRSVVHVPKRLLASDSWRILGDLVNSILLESSKTGEEGGSL